MKKFILFVIYVAFVQVSAFAQCTPDQSIKEPGYYPSEFDPAVVGEDYSQVLQIRVIKDTSVIYNQVPVTAKIDSVNLLEIIGLPSSFDYKCYNATCSYIPSETGCAILEGKAKSSDIGTHPLELVIKVYANVFTVPIEQDDTLKDQFALVVNQTGSVSIQKLAQGPTFYPNPSVNGTYTISGEGVIGSSLVVYDQFGRMIRDEVLKSNALDLSNEANGIYTYRFTNKNGAQTVGRLLYMGH